MQCDALEQEAQSAFAAIEYALQNHQPAAGGSSKIALLSKPAASEGDSAVMQSLLDGLSSEQQVRRTSLQTAAPHESS